MTALFLGHKPFNEIGASEISALVETARGEGRRVARLCLHRDPDEAVQEMVIAIARGAYVCPHRQPPKRKSYVVLEGSLAVVFFDEGGAITQVTELSATDPGRCRLLSFASDRFHTTVPLSRHAVIVETIAGPFVRPQTEWAEWAPDNADGPGVQAFFDALSRDPRLGRGLAGYLDG
ncbi:MAG: WbuC family cupin fold metalloprotein [Alphaproteobacteria bacterium]|nr:WbuC family cupin fold metalloprotein [Alphaproteobacteria bacterium]